MERAVLLTIQSSLTTPPWNFYQMMQDDDDEKIYTAVILHYVLNDVHSRPDGYFEEWVSRYMEQDFFDLYRMGRQTFCNLLTLLACQDKAFTGGTHPVPVEKQLLMTLWWLGKGESLLSVADRFNVVISTVYVCTQNILEKLLTLKTKYITWPDPSELEVVESGFRERIGFPGVIGAIDGTCIQFKCPKDQQDSYIDKECNHSIKLQGIVSSKKLFTSIVVGFPGSAHDSRVFHNSKLYTDIEEMGELYKYFSDKDYHLVGDKAYPLFKWVMTPYKDYGNLDDTKTHYNYCHSVTRMVVEHAFGMLKGRWRCLRYINVNSVERAVKIITASCILHNFCYINYDFWNSYEVQPHEDMEENNEQPGEDVGNKRNQIAQLLMEHRLG